MLHEGDVLTIESVRFDETISCWDVTYKIYDGTEFSTFFDEWDIAGLSEPTEEDERRHAEQKANDARFRAIIEAPEVVAKCARVAELVKNATRSPRQGT